MKIFADMKEHEVNFKNINFKYILKESSLDTKKLIVIFKSFDKNNCLKQYFDKRSIGNIKSTVLLIKDEFNGMPLAYLGKVDITNVDDVIYSFIEYVASEYFIAVDNIVVLGDFIAGSSSLYFGLKYKLRNIISIFPIVDIARYFANNKGINVSALPEDFVINNFLDIKKLNSNAHTSQNIYIFLNELCDITKIQNNTITKNIYFIDCSKFHTKKPNGLGENILQILEAIIKLIEIGLKIDISNVFDNDESDPLLSFKILEKQQKIGKFFRDIKKIKIKNDRCYIQGTAFLQGYERSMPDLLERQIIFKNSSKQYKYNVQVLQCEDNIDKYYSDTYCNYLYSDYFSLKPLDLRQIEYGTYSIWFNIVTKKCLELVYKNQPLYFYSDLAFYILFNENNRARLKKTRLISNYTPSLCNIINKNIKNCMYRCDGQFIINGIETDNIKYNCFYLIFHGRRDYCIKMVNKNSKELNYILDDFGRYNNSYFSTDEAEGVDLSKFEKGSYSVFVTFIHNIYTFSQQIDYIII